MNGKPLIITSSKELPHLLPPEIKNDFAVYTAENWRDLHCDADVSTYDVKGHPILFVDSNTEQEFMARVKLRNPDVAVFRLTGIPDVPDVKDGPSSRTPSVKLEHLDRFSRGSSFSLDSVKSDVNPREPLFRNFSRSLQAPSQ